jgi:hypothetical protein
LAQPAAVDEVDLAQMQHDGGSGIRSPTSSAARRLPDRR